MLRRLLLAGIAATGLTGATAATPEAKAPACREAALVSTFDGAVLRRLSARDDAEAPRGANVLPGEDAVADGHGGWFVSGTGLAHVRFDGTLDRTWHAPLHRRLQDGTLARSGGRLFVSDGQQVFALDAASGRRLWTSAPARGPGRPPYISSVVAGPRKVYLGGRFRRIGSVVHAQLAALDASSGRLLRWHAPSVFVSAPGHGYVPGAVGDLAVSSSRLYATGEFRFAGARHLVRAGVMAVRTSDGGLTGFVPRSPLSAPGLVVAAGRRLLFNGELCDGCNSGVFDGRTGKALHGIGFSEVLGASAIGVHGSIAYLGTGFPGDGFGGKFDLIAIDLRTGRFEPWWPKIAALETVKSIAVSRDRAFVGGSFCAGR